MKAVALAIQHKKGAHRARYNEYAQKNREYARKRERSKQKKHKQEPPQHGKIDNSTSFCLPYYSNCIA